MQYKKSKSGLVAISAVLVFLGIVVLMTDAIQFAKTLFLIARVTPYEQVGSGEGVIQVLGDSTGYGTGASSGKYSVAGRLGADYPSYTLKNKSVNGLTIQELVDSTQEFEGQYDLIVLQMGGNDILQKRDTVSILTDLELLIERLAPHTKEIVMLTSGNVGGAQRFTGAEATELESLTRAYRMRVLDLAENTPNFTYVDLFDEPGNDPFQNQPEIYTSIDGLHPSNEGYGLWYEKAKDTFEITLKKENGDS
jgi:lysophospholipase L1-like esterase